MNAENLLEEGPSRCPRASIIPAHQADLHHQGWRPAQRGRAATSGHKLKDLMPHTIGRWSYWPVRAAMAYAPLPRTLATHATLDAVATALISPAQAPRAQVIEKIELVVPSNLTHPLRVIDVPGFGKEARDSFRQGIVDDQLKQPVSTLCLISPGSVTRAARLTASTSWGSVRRPPIAAISAAYPLPSPLRLSSAPLLPPLP